MMRLLATTFTANAIQNQPLNGLDFSALTLYVPGGPGYLNVDASAFKDFHIIKEQSVGFRFDAFNALNIASYGNPDTSVTDANFGNVSNQGTGAVRSVERHLQFSARYTF
jgi:hypothetical protein